MKKLIVPLFLVGVFVSPHAGLINDVPSCYSANKIVPTQANPATELFIAIDQTTPLDNKLKQQVMEVVGSKVQAGNAYNLFAFSAYSQGHYLEMMTRGQIEWPLPQKQRDDTSSKLLHQFDACMEGQQRFAISLLATKLKAAFNGQSDSLAKSDVIASVKEIADRVSKSTAKEKIVLLVSDMLENSSISSFYAKQSVRKIDTAAEIAKVDANQMFGRFDGAKVYVIGGGIIAEDSKQPKGIYRDPKTMQSLQGFWKAYIEKSGGQLMEFGQPALLNPP